VGDRGRGGRIAPQRTVEELKTEAQARADRNAYPLIGLKPEEVREALANIHSLDCDEWVAARSVLGSLVTPGIIGKPMAPMLVVAGVKDTQVPIADIDLLLHMGETPEDAWINPAGGHMGREAKAWTDPVIFKRVTMPWLLCALEAKAE
jgi:hypothetical protein